MKFEEYLLEKSVKTMTRAQLQAELARIDRELSMGSNSTALINQRFWAWSALRFGGYRDRDDDDENDNDAGDFGGDGGDGGE